MAQPRKSGLIWLVAALLALGAGAGVWFFGGGESLKQPPAARPPASEVQADNVAAQPGEVPDITLPSFDVVRIVKGGSGVIAGRAGPEQQVEILADGTSLAQASADARGQWVAILEKPLPPGPSELSLIARTDSGEVLESTDVVVVAVPGSEPTGEQQLSGVLAILSPKAGGASRVLQRPPSDSRAGLVSIESIDFVAGKMLGVAGSGEAGAYARVYVDDRYVGENRADNNGHWSVTITEDVPQSGGEILLRVDQLSGDGSVEIRVEQTAMLGIVSSLEPGNHKLVVRPGNHLWGVARKLYGSGVQYSLIFEANANAIRDPNLIYPGQVFVVPQP